MTAITAARAESETRAQLLAETTPGTFPTTTSVGVNAITVGTAGTGYAVGAAATFTGGTGTAATAKVTSVNGSGGITGIQVLTPGAYSVAPTTVTFAGGTGGVFTIITAPTNGKRLPAMTFKAGPKVTTTDVQGMGYAAPVLSALNQESTEIAVESSTITYDELCYVLNSLLIAATPTVSDTSAYTWVFQPSLANPDSFQTYAYQEGDDTNGGWMAQYGVFSGMTWTFDRENVKQSGTFLGQKWQIAITPSTASPGPLIALAGLTELPKIPVLPDEISVYVDTTWSGIGTTLLPNEYSVEFGVTERWVENWPLNNAQSSHSGYVQAYPKLALKIEMEANSTADGFLAQLRTTTTKYMRIKAVSPVLAGASTVYYGFTLDIPMQVKNPQQIAATNSVMRQPIEFTPVADPTAGCYLKWSLTCAIATL